MTNPLTQSRLRLAALLEQSSIPVSPHEPDRPAPPQISLSPANPMVAPGSTYATALQTLKILVTVRPGSSANVTRDLEAAASEITDLLDQANEVTEWTSNEPVSLITGQDAIPALEIFVTLQIER